MSHKGRYAYKNVIELGEDDGDDVVIDRGIYFSGDGLTMREETYHGRRKKRRLNPSNLGDTLAAWMPGREDADFDEDAVRNPPQSAVDPQAASILGKRKIYSSTVCDGSVCRLWRD